MERSDAEDESTSDYAESMQFSEFTSINTQQLHSYEHGRRYQGILQDRYGLPNDDDEQTREGIKHKVYQDYILDGKLLLAPIGDHPQKIVDLGTGVGLWAQDVAEHFPSARVIGTDLSPIQPHWTPPNLEFRVEDLEDEFRPWTSIYGNSDLIHIRAVLQTLRDPCRLLKRSFENLRPGGWIEIHEIIPYLTSEDGTVDDKHPMNEFYELIDGPYSQIYGWNLPFPRKIVESLAEIGFVSIQEKHTLAPVGKWHRETRMREIGIFCQSICEDLASAMLLRHDTLDLTAEDADKLEQNLYAAFNDGRIHAQMDWIDCWAQKPAS